MLIEIISKALTQRGVEPFGLPISPQMASSRKIVLHPQLSAYTVEELRRKLWTVFGKDKTRRAIDVNTVA